MKNKQPPKLTRLWTPVKPQDREHLRLYRKQRRLDKLVEMTGERK
jgi:hypothetical protein